MPTRNELTQLQSLPLELKVMRTQQRIREWVQYYGVDGVYVSFSGGKDSTVLLDMVRKLYPTVKAVFINTGLEYPENQQFVKDFDNVEILRPAIGTGIDCKNYSARQRTRTEMKASLTKRSMRRCFLQTSKFRICVAT